MMEHIAASANIFFMLVVGLGYSKNKAVKDRKFLLGKARNW